MFGAQTFDVEEYLVTLDGPANLIETGLNPVTRFQSGRFTEPFVVEIECRAVLRRLEVGVSIGVSYVAERAGCV